MTPNAAAAMMPRLDGRLLLILLCIGTLMIEGFDLQLIAFAAPQILRDFGIDRSALASAFAAALGGMMIGSVIGGVLGDRIGRRPVTLVSVFVFGVMTLSCASAQSLAQIVMLRLLGGIGFGAVFPNVLSLVAELGRGRVRSTPVVLTTVGAPLGGMVGAFVTSWAIPALGWRFCFSSAGGVTILLCAALFLKLPESPAFLQRRVERGTIHPASSLVHSRSPPPTPVRSPLRRIFGHDLARRTLGLSLLSLTLGYVSYLYIQWIPTLLTQAGLPLHAAILGSFFFNLASVATTLAMAWLYPRIGSRRSLLLTQGVFVGSTILFGVFLTEGGGVTTAGVMTSLMLVGIGSGGGGACCFTLSVGVYPIDCRASGSGWTAGLIRLGALLSAFGGALLLRWGGTSPTIFLAGAVAVLAIGIAGTLLIDAHILAAGERRGTESSSAAEG